MLVICSGMIRSGSTLQYNLVRALVERMGCGQGEGDFTPDDLSARRSQFVSWAEDGAIHVIKSHWLHRHTAEMKKGGTVRVCCIHRDIRDVAASVKQKWGYAGDALITRVDNAVEVYYEIKRLPDVLWQRYEDVVTDLPRAVRVVASYLNLDPPERIVTSVEQECRLENMKSVAQRVERNLAGVVKLRHYIDRHAPAPLRPVLRKFGFTHDTYDKHTLVHSNHISEDGGATGMWRVILAEEESEVIMEHHRSWLLLEGYQI